VNDLNGYDIEDLKAGMSASFSKRITAADIVLFATVSGDANAVHLDEEFARTTQFGGRIAHGMLSASVISAALASRLPGPGTVYLKQSLAFRAPVRPDEVVDAQVCVLEVHESKGTARLSTVCRVDGRLVIEGEAIVLVTSRARRVVADAASTRLE
jgi:3-hydroxybutyryl-CoA dehydratase